MFTKEIVCKYTVKICSIIPVLYSRYKILYISLSPYYIGSKFKFNFEILAFIRVINSTRKHLILQDSNINTNGNDLKIYYIFQSITELH